MRPKQLRILREKSAQAKHLENAVLQSFFVFYSQKAQSMNRTNRPQNAIRPLFFHPDYLSSPEGSVLIELGQTKVICTATVEEGVPSFLRGKNQGWITAEYGMLPRSTNIRMRREAAAGKQSGRTVEIQRLIGRSLRAGVDLSLLGERQIIIDCDVIQADGGTRTAAISGGFLALALAVQKRLATGSLKENPIRHHIAAISVGVVQGIPLLDLDYQEDSSCDSDMNIVMSSDGNIVEIQGTAEGATFSPETLNTLLLLAKEGTNTIFSAQNSILSERK